MWALGPGFMELRSFNLMLAVKGFRGVRLRGTCVRGHFPKSYTGAILIYTVTSM